MAATKHTRPNPLVPRPGRWSASESYAIDRMLADAAALELRAPELVLVLGERASALAEAAGTAESWVRAESLVVSARVRIGQRAATVARAVTALQAAEDLGDDVLAAALRTDLAICARSVGAPLTGLAALRQVLDVADYSGAYRAAVLCHLVGCLYQFGQKPDLDRVLAEADRLCGADDRLDDDGKLLARALVRVGISAHRRRHGDVMGAADAARTGLGLLQQLEDPQADGGVVRIRLVLQLVCSLLDRGDTENALEIAQPVLDEPVRAASVAPAGWLRFAVATRILLPSGAVEAAAAVLREGVRSTERHELHGLTAQLWSELAHVENRLGRPAEAIECLHRARAEEHLHARLRRQAVNLLSGQFGNGSHAQVDLDSVLGSVPAAGSARSGSSKPAGGQRESEQPAPSWQAEQSATKAEQAAVEAEQAAEQAAAYPSVPAQPTAAQSVAEQRATAQPAKQRYAGDSAAPGWPIHERVAEPAAQQRPAAHQRPTEPAEDAEPAKPSVTRFKVAPVVALRPGAHHQQAKTVKRLTPVKPPKPAGEEPPLAPAPAAKPRVPLSFEALIKPRTENAADATEATKTGEGRRARNESARRPVSRHDSEHGSVTARSVLDRLGISAGSGGRRRAEPDTDSEPESDAESRSRGARSRRRANGESLAGTGVAAEILGDADSAGSGARSHRQANGESLAGTDAGTELRAYPEATAGADTGSDAAAVAGADVDAKPAREPEKPREHGSGSAATPADDSISVAQHRAPTSDSGEAERKPAATPADEPAGPEPKPDQTSQENWLPRLKLPPSLAPFDELPEDDKPASTSETPFTNAPVIDDGELGDPFPTGGHTTPPDDDLPPDAGLADLLARALAEHQAGTASAAALVKRLGGQTSGEARTVNGHGRNNGESPGNGRHRNGS